MDRLDGLHERRHRLERQWLGPDDQDQVVARADQLPKQFGPEARRGVQDDPPVCPERREAVEQNQELGQGVNRPV